ncbi:4-hydroxy-4-methyl-2-oxoglutarate aldolase [Rhizobiales bacterium GAS191]|nr:4-hydroxy-4-methyl-2-oxoglutarate aldolase [Rhizobiales bacterium GAS191]
MQQVSASLAPSQIDALKRLGAATIHEAQKQTGSLTSAIKPLNPKARLVGRALTVDAMPGDNLVIHQALTRARPGDVLVVNAKGYTEAGPWGDILTLAAQKAGVAGLVIDGCVRDASAIIEMAFPVFARGLCIKGTMKNQPGLINVAIVCGGVRIEPGDVVVGDRDGVVVVPKDHLDDVLVAAKQREEAEAALRRELKAGRSTIELLNLGHVLTRLGIA